jgi:hypothetical protein
MAWRPRAGNANSNLVLAVITEDSGPKADCLLVGEETHPLLSKILGDLLLDLRRRDESVSVFPQFTVRDQAGPTEDEHQTGIHTESDVHGDACAEPEVHTVIYGIVGRRLDSVSGPLASRLTHEACCAEALNVINVPLISADNCSTVKIRPRSRQ